MNRSEKYTLPARILHWLTALAILTAFFIALSIDGKPLHTKFLLINYHKWAGITVLGLVILRVLWRLTHRPPELPDHMASWEKRIAHGGHGLLYILMIAVPIGGWLYSSALGFPIVWFSVVHLPNLVAKDKALADMIGPVHETAAWTLIIVALLHAAAAIKHHFVDRDNVLKRML